MPEIAPTVPTVSAYFNPVLSALRTLGGSASNAEVDAQVARELSLTPEQLALPHKPEVPDSQRARVPDRVGEDVSKKTGHLTNPRRAFWTLTPQGAAAGTVDALAISTRVRAEFSSDAFDAEADLDASADAEPASPGVHFESSAGR